MENHTLVIEDVKQLDLSDIKMPLFALYEKPLDFPNNYVARLFDLDQPTNIVLVADTLEELREKLPKGLHRFKREEEDVKALIETWA